MSYKSKHLSKLVPLATLVVFTLLHTSCQNKNKENDNEEIDNTEQGLLNKNVVKVYDKYGTSVSLYPMSVPLYNARGQRVKDCLVLTRGQDAAQFSEYNYGKLSLHQAHLNDSPDAVYIMVGEHNEVVGEDGRFIGLVLDEKGNVAVVAPQNMSSYISDFERAKVQEDQRVRFEHKFPRVEADVASDKILAEFTDSLANDSIAVDSVGYHKTVFTEKQFLDTLGTKTGEYGE